MGLFRNYLPLLAFAALFRDRPDLAETPYEIVRGDVQRLLAEAEAASAGESEEARNEALFAACAFVDEALLTTSWQGRAAWARQTLQRLYCGTVNAGTEFYEHCRALLTRHEGAPLRMPESAPRAQPPQNGEAQATQHESFSAYLRRQSAQGRRKAREKTPPGNVPCEPHQAVAAASTAEAAASARDGSVTEDLLRLYGACLCMGFSGQYYDQSERDKLYALAAQSLERAVGGRATLGQRVITPEAYYMPKASRPHKKDFWRRVLLFGAFPAALTLLVYLIYAHMLSAFVVQWLSALGSRP
ncbi:DotU family type IV/VI secretion system protein [Desulfovibrio sp. ZJ369]|uniref:DotU family type IV/VI secretion system protein n=1 Tax=Desulfovibrio sp. ZJ369 TaxID=2709793 RepID=UPI0013EC13F7|nr:DotU family type IV/VI secretion system protein [Desulfovibrio sp. ZJ369]